MITISVAFTLIGATAFLLGSLLMLPEIALAANPSGRFANPDD